VESGAISVISTGAVSASGGAGENGAGGSDGGGGGGGGRIKVSDCLMLLSRL